MSKSMTAYGRAVILKPFARIVLEIQSVNRKHLEILTNLPTGMARFDSEIRRRLSSVISRGHVTVRMQVSFQEGAPVAVNPNIPLAKALKAGWDKIAQAVDLPVNSVNLSLLATRDDLFVIEDMITDEKVWKEAIIEAVDKALVQAMAMKEHEGNALCADISARFANLEQPLKVIEAQAPTVVQRQRQKLQDRLNEIASGLADNDERLLREVGLFAERVDISEEITRFQSHLSQCRTLFSKNEGAIGKTLEFILQELNREINTIGSKSNDVEISRNVVLVKGELEKIREQIQNLE